MERTPPFAYSSHGAILINSVDGQSKQNIAGSNGGRQFESITGFNQLFAFSPTDFLGMICTTESDGQDLNTANELMNNYIRQDFRLGRRGS